MKKKESKVSGERAIPVYTFVGGDENVTPVRRKIAKTMEVTENFDMFSVLQYVAKMDKAIADKEGEIVSLREVKKAYLEEMRIIEEQLGAMNLEKMYQEEIALENAKKVEAEKWEAVASPYTK